MLESIRDSAAADRRELAIALWGLGRLAVDRNDISTALMIFPEALSAAGDTCSAAEVAELQVSYASALQVAGEISAAAEMIDAAEPHLSGGPLGRLRMQRGLLLAIGGDRQAAIDEYDAGLPLLEGAGDQIALLRLVNNRGVVLSQVGRLDAATRDFETAARLANELGQQIPAAAAAHNAAYLQGRLGRVGEALRGFGEARRLYTKAGSPGRMVNDLDIDEAAVLIEAGLAGEAAEVAGRVVESCRAEGNVSQQAEASLTLARAHVLAGDNAAAVRAAMQAEEGFADSRRRAWVAAARYWRAVAEHSGGPGGLRDVVRLRRLATELEGFGWAVEATEIRVLMAKAALAAGRADVSATLLDHVAPARRSANTRVRADAWLVTALGQLSVGDRRSAERSLTSGLRTVERYRATLGAGELRTAAGRLGAGLAELGVAMAVERADSRLILTWAERWRAGTLGLPRPTGGPTVPDGLLTELRQARVEAAEGRGQENEAALAGRVVSLEQQVSRLARVRSGTQPLRRRARLTALTESVGQRVLVEYVQTGGRLLAVTVRDRRVRHTDLGPIGSIGDLAAHLSFAIRRMSMVNDNGAADAGRAVGAVSVARRQLDDALFGSIRDDFGDRPLVVIPSADLHHMLWNALPTANRPDGLTTAPSAVWWASERPRTGQGKVRRTLLVAGPELNYADGELEALTELVPRATTIRGRDATASTVLEAMGRADVVHLATHGTFRSDNPWFSTLLAADGPIHVHELDRLTRAPETVMIAACSSGRSAVLAGDELLGTSAALLALGVRTLIAPQLPINDQAAIPVAVAVHRAIHRGRHPGAALAALVDNGLAGGDLASAAAAASFTFVSTR